MGLATPRRRILSGIARPSFRRPSPRRTQSFVLTFVAVALLAGFLSPLIRSASISIKSAQQVNAIGAPIYPADPQKFVYNGRTLDVYQVPIDGTIRNLALVVGGRTSSQFVDPRTPAPA